MSRQVTLELDATAFVRRGEIVNLKAYAKHTRWFTQKAFRFAVQCGTVYPSGGDGSRAYIETHALEPGLYIVRAHFAQGVSPLDQAEAWASFVVTE